MAYSDTTWFEWTVLAVIVGVGILLAQLVDLDAGLQLGYASPMSVHGNHYLDIAQSLVQGRGYTVTSVPSSYALSTPPVYPVMLAGVMKWLRLTEAQEAIKTVHAFNFVLYGLSVALVQAYIRRIMPRGYALTISALYALAPATLVYAAGLGAGMLFICLVMASVLAIDWSFANRDAPPNGWRLAQCCLWLILTVLTKNLGFILLGAFAVLAAWRMGWRTACSVVGVVLLCVAPLTLREIYIRNVSPQVVASAPTEATQQAAAPIAHAGSSRRFFDLTEANIQIALEDTAQNTLGSLNFQRLDGQLLRKLSLHKLNFRLSDLKWVRWTLAALIVLGAWTALPLYSGIGAIYMAVFLASTVLLPVEKRQLLLPVLPFLLLYLFLGLLRFGSWVERLRLPVNRLAFPVLAGLILLNHLNGFFDVVRPSSRWANPLGVDPLTLQKTQPLATFGW